MNHLRFVRTGWTNPYMHALLLIVTLSGIMSTFHVFPAYDPAILALNQRLVWWMYLELAIGGVVTYGGIIATVWDRGVSLILQSLGLALQAWAALMVFVAVTVNTPSKSLFIGPFALLVVIPHGLRVWQLKKEMRWVPFAIWLSRKVEKGGPT